MARLFENNIKSIREDIEETEKLFLEVNKQPLTEEGIKHYSKVFGFDSDEYTAEEKNENRYKGRN